MWVLHSSAIRATNLRHGLPLLFLFSFFFLLWCNQFTHELSSPSMKRKQKKAYNNTKTATKKNAGTANNSSIQNDSLNRRLPSSKTLVYKVTLRNTERRSWKHGNGHRHCMDTGHGNSLKNKTRTRRDAANIKYFFLHIYA